MNPPTPPEPTPENVQDQVRGPRAHMAGQMHALEEKVTDMVPDATEAVEGTMRGARNAVRTVPEQVREPSESIRASVRRALDVRRHVCRHPWLAVGGAITLGFVCAHLVGRR